ncbi:hypothetical protein CCR75_002697 [Bremia lactucae]|uniref:HTH CENPB-type domain-containing protein n=1 Tax=Bremia lactucae TaxID=4779 RepID=A0A976FRA5_BRELC|nr:hypothetical protein CCR75_002697 [Bremia lactucae]
MATISTVAEKVKRPRTTFTNAQRLEICNYKAAHPTITQGQLASWAQESLHLPRKPSQAMISKVLKRKLDLETMTTEELICKSRRTVRFPHLDAALARWVAYCEETGIVVTGESIRAKAARFAEILAIETPLTFSNGWLYKFNERHGFGPQKHRQAPKLSIEQAVNDLHHRVQKYEPRNVFSMDETGLFYTFVPDSTLKRCTQRFSLVLSCNADGSEKVPLFITGQTEKPHDFPSTFATKLQYVQTSNTLFTRELFQKWLLQLNASFRAQDRHCILLLDTAAIHYHVQTLACTHIELVLFPPGTPCHLQPLSAGIVTAFKRRYRRRQLQVALDQVDANRMNGLVERKNVSVNEALLWCLDAWDAVPSWFITSCWYDTGLIVADNREFGSTSREMEDRLSDEIAVMLSWLPTRHAISVDELLHLPEETVSMEEPTDQDFCVPMEVANSVISVRKLPMVDSSSVLCEDELKERLKWIAKLLIYADEKGVAPESVSGMRLLQRDFRDQLKKWEKRV